ncbi:MAG: DUF374 domain-containing protein [Alphaproteobacteria bacterium]|nr:DUF374 domain-containing protein [Alphaproteobacteria bacterium]
MWFVNRTTRWTVRGDEGPAALAREGRAFIVCFWHQRIFMMAPIWARRQPIHMLISSHNDGLLISKAVAHFGIDTIVGSTNRGAAAALRTMLDRLRNGINIGLTPDGPRGPARKAAPGIAIAAMMGNAPVVLMAYSVSRARFLDSWDRFLIPYPFSRGAMIWEVIEPPKGKDQLDGFARMIEKRLDAASAEADRMVGRAPA